MTDTNERLRALILAALMVLSVFAGTIALSGSAAANHSTSAFNADAHLDTDETFWQGQTLYLAAGNPNASETWELRRVDTSGSSNQVGSLEQQITLNGDGAATFGTSGLDGFYVIEDAENNLVTFSGGDISTDASNVDDASFEVTVQSLSASFDEDDLPVDTDGSATIDITSGRSSYTLNVSAEGLDGDDLQDIFDQGGHAGGAEFWRIPADDDDIIQVNASTSSDLEANFTVFDEAGSYTFDFEAADTDASASASVDVSESDVTLNFAQGVITQQEGDYAVITITMQDTDEGYLWVGDQDVNYLERVHFTDENEDGVVVLIMNTRWAGTQSSATRYGLAGNVGGLGVPANPDNSSAFDGADTGVAATGLSGSSYTAVGFGLAPVEPYDEDTIEDVVRFNETDTDLNELTNPISTGYFGDNSPLEPADYSLTLSSTATPPNASDTGELVIHDEEDVATLDLTDRSTNGIRTLVAPTGDVDTIDEDDDEEVAEVLDSMSPSGTLAIGGSTGDQLIVQVNASGLSGYLFDGPANDGTFAALNGTTSAPYSGLWLNISSATGNNRATNRVQLWNNDATIIDGNGVPDDSFLVLLDSRDFTGSGQPFKDGQEYTVSFQVGNEAVTSTVNPYVDAEEEERVETTVNLEDTEAEFDGVVDDEVQVAQDSNATVSGSSNVAPGEEVTVRLRRTGESPFLMTQTVTVAAGGAWSATFDTSSIPVDTTFTATVREGGTAISDSTDGRIVQATTATPTPTTEPPETTTEPPETTTAPPETTTAPPETTMEPTETESPGQPGFGVAIAIVALLGAALLALRRRD